MPVVGLGLRGLFLPSQQCSLLQARYWPDHLSRSQLSKYSDTAFRDCFHRCGCTAFLYSFSLTTLKQKCLLFGHLSFLWNNLRQRLRGTGSHLRCGISVHMSGFCCFPLCSFLPFEGFDLLFPSSELPAWSSSAFFNGTQAAPGG